MYVLKSNIEKFGLFDGGNTTAQPSLNNMPGVSIGNTSPPLNNIPGVSIGNTSPPLNNIPGVSIGNTTAQPPSNDTSSMSIGNTTAQPTSSIFDALSASIGNTTTPPASLPTGGTAAPPPAAAPPAACPTCPTCPMCPVCPDIANDIKLPGLQQSNIERNTTGFHLPKFYLPKGVIVAWNSEIAPVGWALCDGTNGTPNLQGRFILGSNMNRSIGTIGGVETVALSVDQIPPHSHNLLLNSACFKDGGCDSRRSVDGTNIKYDAVKEKEVSKYDYQPQSTGGGKPHENMPPFYTLTYIMKL